MLRTVRIRCGWRATLCLFLICGVNFTSRVAKGAEIPLLSKVRGAAHSAAKYVLQQQSSSQQRLPGQTAPKKATLQGIVRDAGGKPVVAARVTLRSTATQAVLERNTDAQGVFRFIEVPPGVYQMEVHAAGYQDLSNLEIELKAGDDLVRELSLVANPPTGAQTPQFPELPPGNTAGAPGAEPAVQPAAAPVLS